MKDDRKLSGSLGALYRTGSLALLTDLYQLTMAYAYWHEGLAEREAVFHLSFRRAPFGNSYAVAAGLKTAAEFLQDFRFQAADLQYLATIQGTDGKRLFPESFLDYLKALRFKCHVWGVPEGTLLFPQEPLLRVQGPLLQAQIVETALLNILNFQSLIATKAARICELARPSSVIEFGLRRAQGIDGGISASRAAYLGGCDATSNLLAGKLFGIPVRGTHAHSWVLSFDTEREAFEAYARALPGNSLFLVDTYDTLQGVANAIAVGQWLRRRGHEFLGIRLDSGDLKNLSLQARTQLDEAGFPDAVIVASNDLDERKIAELKKAGAPIAVWGVGTRLVTGFDDPALGGIYKLSAIQDEGGRWQHKLKLSEQEIKTSLPGILQSRRFFAPDGRMLGDVIVDELLSSGPDRLPGRKKGLWQDLLQPVFEEGRLCQSFPTLDQSREHGRSQAKAFWRGRERGLQDDYPVLLDKSLENNQITLIERAGKPSGSILSSGNPS